MPGLDIAIKSASTAELFAKLHERLAGTKGANELAEIEFRLNRYAKIAKREP